MARIKPGCLDEKRERYLWAMPPTLPQWMGCFIGLDHVLSRLTHLELPKNISAQGIFIPTTMGTLLSQEVSKTYLKEPYKPDHEVFL